MRNHGTGGASIMVAEISTRDPKLMLKLGATESVRVPRPDLSFPVYEGYPGDYIIIATGRGRMEWPIVPEL